MAAAWAVAVDAAAFEADLAVALGAVAVVYLTQRSGPTRYQRIKSRIDPRGWVDTSELRDRFHDAVDAFRHRARGDDHPCAGRHRDACAGRHSPCGGGLARGGGEGDPERQGDGEYGCGGEHAAVHDSDAKNAGSTRGSAARGVRYHPEV